MADIKKGDGLLKDPILGTLNGEALSTEQNKNNNANLVMEDQIAKKWQDIIDSNLLLEKREELQNGFADVQKRGKDARAADEEAMARIQAESVSKNTVKPKKGLFGWGFWGL